MSKIKIKPYDAFSSRLISAMKQAGYVASRSSSGICIKTLSEVTEASEQICRRYTRGDALPDYEKILKIAHFLQVSPGWLLFGELNELGVNQTDSLKISESILYYMLDKSHYVYQLDSRQSGDYPEFIIGLIKDINAIDTHVDNLKKIIDIAVGSICSFEEKKSRRA